MTRPTIQVEQLGKMYRLGAAQRQHRHFREAITDLFTAPIRRFRRLSGHSQDTTEFWALRNASFEVQPGEVVGIIGRNGAGKSTLLKILSRIVHPTEGRAILRGRVASLLEVGTGFHPELTGRENIYLNGSLLGMRRKEINAKFDAIVAFAEVERFLDTPVKRYSSGMYVRLAFAVAAHLEQEILIVDEVLAVGDAEFQKKCLGKMREVSSSSGRTVLFVSHNMVAIQSLCTRGIVLGAGAMTVSGTAAEAVAAYLAAGHANRSNTWKRAATAAAAPLSIETVSVSLEGQQPQHQLVCRVRLQSRDHHPSALLAVDIHDGMGSWLMQAVPRIEPFIQSKSPEHEFVVTVHLPPLIPGHYSVSIWTGNSLTETIDWAREVAEFEIVSSPTPGRTIPHSPERGFCVPQSTVSRA